MYIHMPQQIAFLSRNVLCPTVISHTDSELRSSGVASQSLMPGHNIFILMHATILDVEPTFMKAQKCPIYLGMHAYNTLLKVHV